MLEGLIPAGITQASMHCLHGLPFTIVEQAVEVLTRRVPLRLSTEAPAEAIQVLAQSPQQRPRGPGGHARSVPDSRKKYTPDFSGGSCTCRRRVQRNRACQAADLTAVRLELRGVDSFSPDGSYFRGLGTC